MESGLAGARLVGFLAPAGEGDQLHPFTPRLLPDPPAGFIAVEPGQPDVEQDDLGPKRFGCGDRRFAIEFAPHLVTLVREDGAQGRGGVAIVIDDQNAPQGSQ